MTEKTYTPKELEEMANTLLAADGSKQDGQKKKDSAKADAAKDEKEAAKDATQEVTDLLSWADTFDEANAETKHMIIARLVERIEINHDYEVEIKFRISVEQYMRIAA